MVDLNRTPAELAELDAIVYKATLERAAAPDLAARYDDACKRNTDYHNENVRLRRRIEDLETVLEAVLCADSVEEASDAFDRARDVLPVRLAPEEAATELTRHDQEHGHYQEDT